MAAAKKNTAGRKTAKPKTKKWVVPIEATITGYITVDAFDEEIAIEVVDQRLEDMKVDVLGGKTIDGADFLKFVARSEVSQALALEDVFVAKSTRKPQKKEAPKTTAKKSTKKAATKGRTRGTKATDPSTGKKAATKTKTAAKSKSTARKGRTRGVAKS